MQTVEEIIAKARAMHMVPIEEVDRDVFAVALVLQGYDASRARRMAYEEIEDNDGALQMLARHRVRFSGAALPKEGEEEARLAGRRDAREVFDRHEPAMAEALSSLPVRSGEAERLRAHIAEQITHVEQRIKDGVEMGAIIWRISLEDVVRENRAALAPPPQAQVE